MHRHVGAFPGADLRCRRRPENLFPRMRHALSALLLCLSIATPSACADETVKLVRVWPGYRDAASFTTLGEYFSDNAASSGETVLRSQARARAGFYWLIRTATATAHPASTLTVRLLRAGQNDVETHTFAIDLIAGGQALHAGLTGRDWIDPAERPVAWQITISAADGTPLASEQSFLWNDAPST